MAIFGHCMVQLCLNNLFKFLIGFCPLRIGIIKSRFHHIRGRRLQISWFLNVLTCLRASKPVLFNFGETRIPQKILETIWNHPGKIFSLQIWVSKNSTSESQIWVSNLCTQFFGSLKIWNFEILKFYIFFEDILSKLYFTKMRIEKWLIFH